MNPDREQQRDQILEAALSVDIAKRSEFIKGACGDDSELRVEIERLMELHGDLTANFLEEPVTLCDEQSRNANCGLEATAAIVPEQWPRSKSGESIRQDIEQGGRFKVVNQLGRGTFGIVYEAYDFKRGETVALKLLRDLEPHFLYRFKQEFRLIQDVVHPNLLKLFELIQQGDSIFFTMELVRGIDFIEYVRGPARTQFDEGRLRLALSQLASATQALHTAKLIHRDIKPSNILVDSSGHLTLLDFGLIKVFGPEGGRQTMVAGTPYYMAPEQARGETLTEAADWYSVGAVLYEALTGKSPREESETSSRERNTTQAFLAPATLDSRVPDDLNRLCVNLLQDDPAARPKGADVLACLSVPASATVRASNTHADTFVGRADILAGLVRLVHSSAAGSFVIATISGRSGVGKTALIDRFIREVSRSRTDVLLLRGRCLENEFVPFKAIDDLVDQLSRKLLELRPAPAMALLPRELGYLIRVFPVLGQVDAIATRADQESIEIGNPQELRRRGFAALRQLLVHISDLYPLVAIIDDIHWGDLDSIPFFEELVSNAMGPKVLLVCSFRSEHLDSNPFVPAFQRVIKQASSAVALRSFEVPELTHEESLTLASHLLSQGGSSAMAAAIASDSGGNPLFIAQFAAALNSVASGNFRAQDSQPSFSSLIRQRLSGLPGVARRLLEFLAAAGSPMPQPLLLSLLGSHSEAASELNNLLSEQLVRRLSTVSSGQIEIFHSRIRESILEGVPEDDQRILHRELALALEEEPNSDPALVSHHFQMAGMNQYAINYALAAGDKAAHGLAFERAAQCYLSCVPLHVTGTRERRDLILKLADVLVNAGRGIEAATYYLEAAESSPPDAAVRLKRRAVDQLLRSGDIAKGEAILKSLGEKFSLSIEPSLSSTLLRAALARFYLRVRGLRYRERPDSEVDSKALERLETYWSMATSLTMFSPLVAMLWQFRHLLLSLRTGAQRHLALALAAEAAQLMTSGATALPEAEQVLAEAFEISARTHDETLFGFASTMSVLVRWLAGSWRKTTEEAASAERVLVERCVGVAWELGTVRVVNIGALIWMGEWDKVRLLLSSYIKDAEQRGDLHTTAMLQLQAWITCLARDDVAAAYSTLTAAQRTLEGHWAPRGFHLTHLWGLVARIHILLYEGRGLEASALLESEWGTLSRSFVVRVQMMRIWVDYLRAACAIAAAVQDRRREDLLSLANHSIRRLRRGGRCGEAFALLSEGLQSAALGQYESAAQAFERAETLLNTLEMSMFADASRHARAVLVGGATGEQLKREAETAMLSRGVLRPDRIARMFCPVQGMAL